MATCLILANHWKRKPSKPVMSIKSSTLRPPNAGGSAEWQGASLLPTMHFVAYLSFVIRFVILGATLPKETPIHQSFLWPVFTPAKAQVYDMPENFPINKKT